MKKPKLNPRTDAVITVSGGCVTGVYAPDNIRVIVLDFDNIEAGDTVDLAKANWNEGNVATRDARDAVDYAIREMKKHRDGQK